ncbi:hypothetical protein [Thermococcus gammatolerans]|uniref:hypothetical protein n=1 Tax=Thermococcus gammatolerans TaxID=187878 RepID=UPI000B1D4934|nr:hypothetical protein [Thermococcus gammatolerans]
MKCSNASASDLHYPTIEKLKALVERAGGRIIRSGTFEPKLPHYLAYIPREYVARIEDEEKRAELLRKWDEVYEKWKIGAEHPPVGWLSAKR